MAEGTNQKLAHDYTDAVFVGVGGCGINTISRLRKAGIMGTRTVFINRFTEGPLAKGGDVVNFTLNGAKYAPCNYRVPISVEERAEAERRIREVLKDAKKVLLFAGLGGFTGTAIAPVVAAAAKAEGALLGVVLTFPFKLEKKRVEAADKALPGLSGLADDFLLRKNDDLVDRFPNMLLSKAFDLCDMELAEEIKKGGRR